MIGELRGVLHDVGGRWVLRDGSGVGWAVSPTFTPDAGAEVTLVVTTVWRESSGPELWAHADVGGRDVFEALCAVHGVGPAIAGAIVRSLGPGGVVAAVSRRDAGAFGPVRGVGPKMAGRILTDVVLPESVAADDAVVGGTVGDGDELTAALVDLGFGVDDARTAVARARSVEPGAGDEVVLGAALAELADQ